jgi:hypothetical protein
MASTYSSLKFELIGTGEQSGTWGTTTNVNLGTAIEEAITGSANVTFASGPVTLTLTDTNGSQTARNLRLNLTGTSGGAQNLIVPAIEKFYLINNGCADAITVKNSTGTGIAVPAGRSTLVYNNGTNVLDAVSYLSALAVGGTLGVTGNTTLGGTLGVTGNTTLGGTLGVTGATTLSSTLGVTGVATFTSAPILSSTTPSKVVFTNSSKAITSTGTVGVDQGGTNATTAAQAKINLQVITSATGSNRTPVGTLAQRDGSPQTGFFRFNTTYNVFEGYNGTAWGQVGGGATGAGGDTVFVENSLIVTTSYTITACKSASSTGPITVNSGVTVTVPSGSRWVIL